MPRILCFPGKLVQRALRRSLDVQCAHSKDGEFDWFEISRPLDSAGSTDWTLEAGQTVGNDAYDSFLTGIVTEEGDQMRYLELKLGDQ
jgi:hypothetical protein